MTKKQAERAKRLLPDGIPRWIRCYDNGGKTADRYTVVFTGRYTHNTGGQHWLLFMDKNPMSPGGIGMHNTSLGPFDDVPNRWGGVDLGRKHPDSALGLRIPFTDLPEQCRKLAVKDYRYLWSI